MTLHTREIADLLADESFIRYCKGGPPEDVARWEAFRAVSPANHALADAAQEQFMELFNALAQADLAEQEARLARRMLSADETPVVHLHEPVRNRRSRFVLRWAAIIIPVIALAAGAWLYKKAGTSTVYQTSFGERKNFHLPDGSFVQLNAGSFLRLEKGFGAARRDLYLEGEAYFDVKHNANAAFVVHTASMDVRAIGTAFNVRSYAGDSCAETVLINGIVEVTLKGPEERKVVLRPNHKIRWNARELTGRQPRPQADKIQVKDVVRTNGGDIPETGWIHNKLIFEDETLASIAVKLERWFGVRVVIKDENLRNYRFTGTFEQEGLVEILDVCQESRHFNYTITSGEHPLITIFR